MTDFLKSYLPLLLPLITIPIFMKLIAAPLIFSLLKKRYLAEMTSTIKDGWIDERDIEAIEYLKEYAWKGLSSPFVTSYNYLFLKEELKTIFIKITDIYTDVKTPTIDLKFSIQRILEALFMLVDDLYRDLNRMKLYKILEKQPLTLFLRIRSLNRVFKTISRIPVVKFLQKLRLSGKLIRIIMIPLLGIPILIYQLIISFLYSIFFEGFLRFIYGLILIKTGYYIIYLYSSRRSSTHNRFRVNHKDIITRGAIIEKEYTRFKSRYRYTDKLEKAVKTLEKELKKINILPSRETSSSSQTLDRVLKRISNTLKNTIESEIGKNDFKSFNLKPLTEIAKSIGHVYYPKTKQPIYTLRVKEFLELGYFLSTVSLKNIYLIPASHKLLDRIPVKFVLDVTDYLEEKKVKEYIPYIKGLYRYLNLSRIFIKRSHPLIIVTTMVTPILYQQLQDSIKEYIFNMAGLLLIDAYESTAMKDSESKIMNISD